MSWMIKSSFLTPYEEEDTCVSYEEEDTYILSWMITSSF
jgi:hypothetical protein